MAENNHLNDPDTLQLTLDDARVSLNDEIEATLEAPISMGAEIGDPAVIPSNDVLANQQVIESLTSGNPLEALFGGLGTIAGVGVGDTPSGSIAAGMPAGAVVTDFLQGKATGPIIERDLPTPSTGVNEPTVQTQRKLGEQKSLSDSPELQKVNSLTTQRGQLLNEERARTQDNIAQLQKLNEIAAPLDQIRNERLGLTSRKIAANNELATQRFEKARQEIDNIKAEMANTDWSTYWGSKSVGDKLLLSLAVGLGAYGQSRIGGRNIALDLINSFQDEHNEIRKARFGALKDRFTLTSQDANNMLEGTNRLNNLEIASRKADLEKVAGQLETLQKSAKTQLEANKIAALSAEIQAKMLQEDRQTYTQLAAQSIETRDIMSSPQNTKITFQSALKYDPTTGKTEPMTQDEKKWNAALGLQASAFKTMREYERGGLLTDPQRLASYSAAYDAIVNVPTTSIGEQLDDVAQRAALGSKLDGILKGDQALKGYFMAMYDAGEAETRAKTGAVMAPSELAFEARKYLPTPLSLTRSVKGTEIARSVAEQARERTLEKNKMLSGSPMILYYEEGYREPE
jgi:hypothetical protein